MTAMNEYIIHIDKQGSVAAAMEKTASVTIEISDTDEHVFPIPTFENVFPKYLVMTTGDDTAGQHHPIVVFYTDDASDQATSIVSGGPFLFGSQMMIRGERHIRLSKDSTHIHYKSTDATGVINFEFRY